MIALVILFPYRLIEVVRFFQRKSIVKIVDHRVRSLRKAVQLMKSMSPLNATVAEASYWSPSDIHKSSNLLTGIADADLLKLAFLTQVTASGKTFIDIDRASLFGADDGAVSDLVAAEVRAAFPADHAAKLPAIENAVRSHVDFHNAQALTMHCLRDFRKIMRPVVGHANLTSEH